MGSGEYWGKATQCAQIAAERETVSDSLAEDLNVNH